MTRPKLRSAILILSCAVVFGAQALGIPALAASPQAVADATIVSDIQSKLFEDSVLKARDIRVSSQDGVVTLEGTVNTDLEKAAVERIASQEPGVKKVEDGLSVSVSATPPPVVSAPAPVVSAPPASAPPSPVPSDVTVPAGTVVTVQMIDAIDSTKNHPGDEFDATVASAIVVGDRVGIAQSSNARVRLVDAKSAGHMTGRSELLLELVTLTVNGTPYTVQSGYHELQGASRGKRTAETVGGGAGLGALIGAVAGEAKGLRSARE